MRTEMEDEPMVYDGWDEAARKVNRVYNNGGIRCAWKEMYKEGAKQYGELEYTKTEAVAIEVSRLNARFLAISIVSFCNTAD